MDWIQLALHSIQRTHKSKSPGSPSDEIFYSGAYYLGVFIIELAAWHPLDP